MRITIGTFNLNNLFSRYNFSGQVEAIKKNDTGVSSKVTYKFTEGDVYRLRTFKGRLVKTKDKDDRATIAARVKAMDVDVLAVQEVENIDILKTFNHQDLGSLYPYYTLIEGNDPRLIDVGLLSKYPLGQVTSWHQAVHAEDPDEPIFGRDLLQVEVLNPTRRRTLFTVFNTHLKSHFVDFRDDPVAGKQKNDTRRRRQAETVRRIIEDQTRPNSRYILTGDMNDPPEAAPLAAFANSDLGLVNALAAPTETRPPKADTPMPPGPAWTHRFKPSGKPAEYHLYDHIWLSPSLAPRQTLAMIDRRTKHGGDGSDHDPAWIELDL
ncbi:endonuclease/exonuclease/phosphatase family protein [Pelagibius sp.]|uniref:endonuclease/exonuclease/phosphatase family protein n=1 Tax=Pelagibius sp. TaxID=1931238 RepID=UPI003B500FDA